jgi:hypothetical protein
MTFKCPEKDCWAPEIACNLGWDLTQCPHFKGVVAKNEEEKNQAEDAFLLPWSSNSLGIVDLQFVAGRSKPLLIGIIGPHNAGKTTLLTVLYLLLSQGWRVKGRRFAGSYTLGGWENLAHSLRWTPNQGPHFPPHTPNDAGRLPGLLHLAFRRDDGVLEDVLLTDAPGEWFERWAIDKSAPDLDGARWISRNSDAFMFLFDSEALIGEDRGEARTNAMTLAQRLGGELMGRPVAAVWSKSDLQVKETIKSALTANYRKQFEHRQEFSVSVDPEGDTTKVTKESFIELLSWLLESHSRTESVIPVLGIQQPSDPMLSFRG